MKMTKRLLILLGFLTLFAELANAQNPALYDHNGWEFLNWEWNKERVEDSLRLRGIAFDPGLPTQKPPPATIFTYQDMRTRLAFDLGQLHDIQQYKYFGMDEREKAEVFYKNLKTELINKYGAPTNENDDSCKKEIHARWKLKYTKVDLSYSYAGTSEYIKGQAFRIFVQTNKL